jgi:DnaA-homolog protein
MAVQIPLQFEFRANQTFANFYASANQEIIDHLQQCVAGVGERQIFLWGQSGQGKSHLLQASCREAQTQHRSSFYYCFNASDLPDPGLLSGLDGIDIVCLDNIEYIAGHAAWELAFFHFYNQHREIEHQLILSAAQPPIELPFQLPDLKTRLNWGLTLKIQPLNDADRIGALRFKAEQMGFELSPQAGRFLLTHYARDLASLWLLLDKLDTASLAAKRKITVPFLKQILDENHAD